MRALQYPAFSEFRRLLAMRSCFWVLRRSFMIESRVRAIQFASCSVLFLQTGPMPAFIEASAFSFRRQRTQ
jgi:hypothetical protein